MPLKLRLASQLQDTKRKQHVAVRQVFWGTSWTILWFTINMALFDTPYDRSFKLRKGKGSLSLYPVWNSRDCNCYFPLWIDGKNISLDHAKNLTFKMFSAFQKWTYPLSFLWPLSRCQIFRTYWVKEAEQRGGGGSKTQKGYLRITALTPGYCGNI